jgi:signal peptidase I
MIHQLITRSVRGLSVVVFVIALICCSDANEIAAATVNTGLQSTYRVPGGEMEPTLKIGQHVQIRAINPRASKPYVGEIVLSHPSAGWDHELCGPTPHMVSIGGTACSEPEPERSSVEFLNRIVAGPGDVIAIREGHVIRNRVRERDHYIRSCGGVPECDFPVSIKIPPGHWFVMGDNRGESDDSRIWGPVPTSWMVGAVVLDQRQQ